MEKGLQLYCHNEMHLIGFSSHSLKDAEQSQQYYSISELEALTVVWATSLYYAYLYGQLVTVLTDHATIKAKTQHLALGSRRR